MLAKGGYEGECQEWRNRQAKYRGQQVPVAGRAAIGQATTLWPIDPGPDHAQAEDVQGCAETEDGDQQGARACAGTQP
jgi:hypothetical protein